MTAEIAEKVYQANPDKPKIRMHCHVRGHEKAVAEPITLADVFLAISKSKEGRLIGMEVCYGNFLQYRADEIGEIEDWHYVWDKEGARVKWNYLKDLEEQSEDTIKFIWSLLTGEGED